MQIEEFINEGNLVILCEDLIDVEEYFIDEITIVNKE